ncbi:hypothetical protein F0P96_10550 [Hymenobacter busanensis]|uniref:Uncharacterized protein n=1 Tax=Hymenobacter busanensis TaxID=2607656 RepID=A0A7L5A2C8_9BACT|nr:hypothetical protein [Hymenobacter busanensis]KAA9333400.1 hypothetical protein F0P96_10550 [Hymenobacter busanensis]QHJ07920.1 hypothetical protein GUY19_11755 [Hymenobacter busanensis]
MAAGDFSASTLSTVIEKQEDLFKDPRNSRLYAPKAEALLEIIRMQTANVSLLNTSAQNKVKIAFVNTSAITTQDCTNECAPDGTLLQTAAQEFTLSQCVEATPFRVEVPLGAEPDSVYANGVYGLPDAVAAGMLKQEKEIVEKMAAVSLGLVAAKAGTNQDPAPEYGAVIAGTNTTIPAANWTANIFPFFQLEAELNRFGMPYMLHGRNLYLEKLNAVPNAQNDDQRDEQAKYDLIESAWDPFSFQRAALTNISLMVDAGAIAFGARNEYGAAVVEAEANVRVFSIASRFVPGVRFDVKKIRKCVNGVYFDVYTMKAPYFDIINNPANGITGDTGVLKFTKGA